MTDEQTSILAQIQEEKRKAVPDVQRLARLAHELTEYDDVSDVQPNDGAPRRPHSAWRPPVQVFVSGDGCVTGTRKPRLGSRT